VVKNSAGSGGKEVSFDALLLVALLSMCWTAILIICGKQLESPQCVRSI
jgi:hypothetical protein